VGPKAFTRRLCIKPESIALMRVRFATIEPAHNYHHHHPMLHTGEPFEWTFLAISGERIRSTVLTKPNTYGSFRLVDCVWIASCQRAALRSPLIAINRPIAHQYVILVSFNSHVGSVSCSNWPCSFVTLTSNNGEVISGDLIIGCTWYQELYYRRWYG